MKMAQILALALLVEAIWESLKMIRQDNKLSIDRIGAIAIGVVLTVNYQLDLFTMVDIANEISWIGVICTGILVSRGANFIHDIFSKLQKE